MTLKQLDEIIRNENFPKTLIIPLDHYLRAKQHVPMSDWYRDPDGEFFWFLNTRVRPEIPECEYPRVKLTDQEIAQYAEK